MRGFLYPSYNKEKVEQTVHKTLSVESQLIRQIMLLSATSCGSQRCYFPVCIAFRYFGKTYLTNGRRPRPVVGRKCENSVQLERGELPETSRSNLEKIKLKL